MRITPEMTSRLMTGALGRHQRSMYSLQKQLASGRKVTLASDDPGAYEIIRNLTSDKSLLEQFGRNATLARHYLTMVDQSLGQTLNIMHRVNELAVRGADGTVDEGTRSAMAEELDQLLAGMLAVANGSEGGRHAFSGLRSDMVPYQAVTDPDTGRITAVEYQGSEETRLIQTGQALYVPSNIPGSSSTTEGGVFQTATRDLFGSIIELRDALLAGENLADTNLAERAVDDVTHLLNQASLNGARMDQVRMHQAFTMEMRATQLESIESIEAVDLAEAFMYLTQAETAYQASLNSTARLLQQISLLHYV